MASEGAVRSVQWIQGKELGVIYRENSATVVLDLQTEKEVGKANISGYTHQTGITPDGTLAVADRAGDVQLWSPKDHRLMGCLLGMRGGVYCSDISEDGRYVVAAGGSDPSSGAMADGDPRVHVWDLHAGEFISTAKPMTAMAMATDWKRGAWGDSEGGISVFTISPKTVTTFSTGHKGAVNSLRFDPSGGQLLSAGADGTVRIWNVETGKEVGHWDAGEGLDSAMWTGKRVLALLNHKAVLWESGVVARTLEAKEVKCLWGGGDGRYVLTGGRTGGR